MLRLNQSPPKILGAIAESAVLAFIISFLFAVISIDANFEQEAFNHGAIDVALGAAMIVGALVAYIISASFLVGRVM